MVSSVVALANEWHEHLRKEAEAREAAHRGRHEGQRDNENDKSPGSVTKPGNASGS